MEARQIPCKIPDILLAKLVAFSLVYAFESALLLNSSLSRIALYVCICVTMLLMFFNRTTTFISFSLIGMTVFVFYHLHVFSIRF